MRQGSLAITLSAAVLLLAGASEAAEPPARPLMTCPVDAVVSGTTCMDKYEASVWRVPNSTTTNRALVAAIQSGTATAAALRAAGATLLGLVPGDYAPCAVSGQNCADDIYAASLPGVMPSASITWFQAQQACKNARKRLPTNAEWQAAAAGTPDPGSDNGTTDCNTNSTLATSLTGSRRNCVSASGAFDMVGNMAEWVAEWVPRSTTCGSWSPDVTLDDFQCLAGAATTGEPGALLRGGPWFDGMGGGPLSVLGTFGPSRTDVAFGVRCAR
jgi:formylglycine-generating enzyme required for sulfatase activity